MVIPTSLQWSETTIKYPTKEVLKRQEMFFDNLDLAKQPLNKHNQL